MTATHTAAEALPDAFDEDTSEHILLEGDGGESAERKPLTKTRGIELRDGLRGTTTTLDLYAEGFLKTLEGRRGRNGDPHRLDLRYLDPVPSIDRHLAGQWLRAGLTLGGAALVLALLALIDAIAAFALPATLVAATAAIGALFTFFYRSHEKIVFVTLHGRAPVLTLRAGLGYARRVREALPALSGAIEDAGEGLGDDTKTYLRLEMREHYRLRQEGVLSPEECSDGTGRILAQFDTDF
jgi:hypothetical protein